MPEFDVVDFSDHFEAGYVQGFTAAWDSWSELLETLPIRLGRPPLTSPLSTLKWIENLLEQVDYA